MRSAVRMVARQRTRTMFSMAVPRITQMTLLKLNPGQLPEEERNAVITLTRRLPGVTAASFGRNVGDPEDDFTDAIVTTIVDEEGSLEHLRTHPDNLAIEEILNSAAIEKERVAHPRVLAYAFEHEAMMKPKPALALGLVIGLVIGAACGRATAASTTPLSESAS